GEGAPSAAHRRADCGPRARGLRDRLLPGRGSGAARPEGGRVRGAHLRTLRGRGERVEAELMGHAVRAVDALGVDPLEIGTVLTASLYSLGCPTLAHR